MTTQIETLLRSHAYDEAMAVCRRELAAKDVGQARAFLLQALAIAMAYRSTATESEAREAVELLASALLEPPEDRYRASESLGEPGAYLVQLIRLLPQPGISDRPDGGRLVDHNKRMTKRPDPPQRTADRQELLERAIQGCHGALEQGWPEVLLALLPRAIDVCMLLAPASSMHRELVLALDQVGEYFADKWTAIEFLLALAQPEDSVDQETAADQCGLLRAFASAAEAGHRPALAARFLAKAPKPVSMSFVERARLLAWRSRLSADGGDCAKAFLLADELLRAPVLDEEWRATWQPVAIALQGRALTALGEHARGRKLLDRALGMRQLPDEVAWRTEALIDLYTACLGIGDSVGAGECHRRLMAVGRRGETSRAEVQSVGLDKADPNRAVGLLQEALTGEEGSGLTLPALLRVALRLLRIQIRQHDLQAAAGLYTSLVDAAQNLDPDHPVLSELDEIGAALRQGEDPGEALRLLFQATARDIRCAPQLLALGSARSRARILDGFRRRTEGATALLIDHFRTDKRLVGGVHALVLRQKGLRTALDWQAAMQEAPSPARAPELSHTRAALATTRSELAAALLKQWHGADSVQAAARLVERAEDLEWDVARLLGGLQVRSIVEVPSPSTITLCLPPDSVYLDYYAYRPLLGGAGRRYAAFVLASGMLTDFRAVELGDEDEVDALLERYRAGILHKDQPAKVGVDQPGELLRRRLIDPLLPHLRGHTRLIICPDRALFILPWECLPDASGGHLIDRFCISYVYTSRSVTYHSEAVIHSAAHRGSVTAPVVIGAPDYGKTSKSEEPGSGALRFGDLSATAQEATDVAEVLGVDPVLGGKAVKEVLQHVHDPVVVHLATHGFVLPSTAAGGALDDVPFLRAGLAMAGANLSPEGILSAAEVLPLQLRNTALVVLSACDTGLGVAQEGEGVASLGRAFDTAGASAVITGMWTVPDHTTNELMLRFYAHLLRGSGCAEALRAAKLEVKAHSYQVRQWGGFISAGRWGSIAAREWSDDPPIHQATP